MKERLLVYWQAIIKNVDRSTLIAELVLLIVIFVLYIQDTNVEIEQPKDPIPKAIETIIPNDNYTSVFRLFSDNPKLENDENVRTLQEYNMFDFKIVRDRETYMKEWDEKYKQAEKLFAEGNLKESLDILKQILLHWPGHLKAKALKKTIDDKLRPPPTPSPTPSPKAPPPGAQPAPEMIM